MTGEKRFNLVEMDNKTIYIRNTLTGEKEPFVPLVKGKIGMYVCSPTI